MATPQENADAIAAALSTRNTNGATGTLTVTIDGQTSTFSEAEARAALTFWERRAARAAGRRRLVNTLDLRNT